MDEAQDSGESTLWTAVEIFLRIRGKGSGRPGDQWPDAVFKSNYYGKPLYTRAKELHFDHAYVRQAVRCLVLFALADVETGPLGLYADRELEHGTQYDDEGNLLMPDMDFDVTCLPRSAFHLNSEGTVKVPADHGLRWVEMIREVCEWYDFSVDYQDATDLMSRFLKDALCHFMTRHRGHKWHLDLANQYQLADARTYIEGFYATLFGTVFLDTDHELKPAPNATVMVVDPSQTWETVANGDGEYEIGGAILHDKCSPFDIFGRHRGDEVADEYDGPLHDPDPSARHGKDLVIKRSERAVWSGSLTLVYVNRFDCEASQNKPNNTYHLRQHDETQRVLTLNLTTEDLDLDDLPVIPLSEADMDLSGRVVWWVNEFKSNLVENKVDICYDQKLTPGDWMRQVETLYGHRECSMTRGLDIAIRKAQMASAGRMRELMQEMSEHANEPQRLAELNAELEAMMNPNAGEDSIPLRIRFQVGFECPITARFTRSRWDYDRCEGTTEHSESSHDLKPPGVVFAIEVDGIYERNDDGTATITADHQDSQEGSNPTSGWDCPPAFVREEAHLRLKRVPIDD